MSTTAVRPVPLMNSSEHFVKRIISSFAIHFTKLQASEVIPELLLRRSLRLIRYLLFILTSAFYLAGPPVNAFNIKVVVVLTMLVATLLAQNLYDSWDMKSSNLQTAQDNSDVRESMQERKIYSLARLIIIETMGIALLLLPTGGLDSPFAWYALNPIIAAAVFLPGFICWGVLALFLATASMASQIYPGVNGSVLSFTQSHLSELLVFFLTTMLVQVAAALYNQLTIAYDRLNLSHAATERSLDHIASLYQALEAFTTREDLLQLADVLAVYSGRLCEAPAACFLKGSGEDGKEHSILRVAAPRETDQDINWEEEISHIWNRIGPGHLLAGRDRSAIQRRLTAVPIISHGEYCGLLAYDRDARLEYNDEEKMKSLNFLAELGGIIIGRLKTDKLWGRLLVSEEQNRISNEIHDGVSQYLFSMVCALHSLSKENAYLQEERIQEQVGLLEETARRVSTELRASIYQLNPSKRGESIFVDNLASYLDELGRLNGIQVDLQTEGSEEVLSPALRKGLYRIVREACSNAIRHGECSALEVRLTMSAKQTVLEIENNGRAFPSVHKGQKDLWKTGLGLRNMNQISAGFNGELKIESKSGRGALVRCAIPKYYKNTECRKEAII
ncbi:MAG TPA: ATP-binding protein [Syntrophomonadaceae bacterium]|nr:ATP-binding protein [Syntrophomonadaceae bacterium]